VLGRDADCDISDLFNHTSSVSRFHAVVELAAGQYFVEDNGSRNGTYLNGKRLTERVPLRSGDCLGIASVELTFLEEADGASAVPAAPAAAARLDRVSYTEPASPPTPLSSLAVTAPGVSGSVAGYSADKLRALVLMLKSLGRSLEVQTTLTELLSGLFAMFPQAQRGVVAFTADGQDDVTPRATYFHREEVDPRIGISRTLVRHVLSRREAVLWADQDPTSGLATPGTLTELCIHSLMCAPLLDGDGNPFGVVQIDTDQPMRKFTPEDLEVMVGAVSQAAVAVRFVKLYEEGLRRQAIVRDLELARRVQLGLLPEAYPNCEGYEFFAYYRSAYDVGGDYYDFIELPNERLALVVADVAGKGVSAALLMAKLSGELKYHLSCEPPGAALGRMNEVLCSGGTGRFVTLLTVIVDRRTSMLTLVNAGLPAPLRRRPDGSVVAIGQSERGPALGLLPDRKYTELQASIEPGDVWIAYTDGFPEAANARGEMFGASHLREGLAQAPGMVQESGGRIVQEVLSFLGDQPQSDDMCLIGWGRLP
jgi:serine phosphatase RsbU (regulator of sigma subunit)